MLYRVATYFVASFVFSLLIFAGADAESLSQNAPKRPLVLVPGILGSKLCNAKELVWGERKSLANFARLNLAVRNPEPLRPCGLLEDFALLGPFWKIEGYSQLVGKLRAYGYVEGETLFQFDYDWRRSNAETAVTLGDFIRTIRSSEIDIIAHSMGGLVTSIALQQQPDVAARVRKVIFMGTPFLGSMNVFGTLSKGWGGFENLIAGGIDTIRSTALSLPSLYEMLPSYANCCRHGYALSYDPIDPMVAENWRKFHWLPNSYDSGELAGYFDTRLIEARRLQEIFKGKIPSHISVVRVVSDVFATDYNLIAPKGDPSWQNWRFVKARGDQTVPAWSAANNLSSLANTTPSFSVHGSIFNDLTTQSIVERELLDIAAPRKVPLRLLTTKDGTPKTFEYLEVSAEPAAVPVGKKSLVRFSVNWGQATFRGEIAPRALLVGPREKVEITLFEITTPSDLEAKTSTFVGAVDAPNEVGSWPIIIDLPGFEDPAAELTSYEPL